MACAFTHDIFEMIAMHLVILSVRRSRLRDGAEWPEMAVQRLDPVSPRWRARLSDRDGAAPSASGQVAAMRFSSC